MSQMLKECECKQAVITEAVAGTIWWNEWKEVQKVYDAHFNKAALQQKVERFSVIGGK